MRPEELSAGNIESVAPMWRSLYEHHFDITSQVAGVAPPRTAAESWASRRVFYVKWLR